MYDEIRRVGMEQSLLEGVVLTGGGAQLHGMCDVAERILNARRVTVWRLAIEDWPEELDDPVWTTAGGSGDVFGAAEAESAIGSGTSGLTGMLSR